MKTLTAVVCTLILTAGFSNLVSAQEQSSGDSMKGQMMDMMADPSNRSMIMADIARNPEMRQEMMQQMMQQMKPSLDKDAGMEMHEMMSNPQMKEKMQKHLNMMQAMLDMDGSDAAKMKEMMNNQEMKSMMRMHAMCSQMMKAGNMEQDPSVDGENHVHKQ